MYYTHTKAIMMQIPASIKRMKKRRILVISAGGMRGGIQGVYFGMRGPASWEILSHAFIPYPERIATLFENILQNSQQRLALADLGWLEYKVTLLFHECAKAALAQAPGSMKLPHVIVLNRLSLWKGPTGENLQQSNWDVSIGDAQFLASSLGIPVITDFVRHHILAGGTGQLPGFPGNLAISPGAQGVVAFVNIGLVSRMSIIDRATSSLVVDSDTGPGTNLINRCAKEAECPDSFDRDGSYAAQGTVHSECLHAMTTTPWFQKPAPKFASAEAFEGLLDEPCLKELSKLDKLATVTALTARSIYEFFRREYSMPAAPETIWISGGGAHNQVLIEFLKTYFDSVPVKSIEDLGIPTDVRIPLALGLTVDAFLSGNSVPWETGSNPVIPPLARWVLP